MRGGIEEAIPPAGTLLYSLVCWRKTNASPQLRTSSFFWPRADAGKLLAGSENVNLSELIQEISEDFSILADAKGVRLDNQIDLDVSVTGDRFLLRQLFLNLFDNAVNHKISAGWILARLQREGSNAIFSISNSSEAIPVEMQTRILNASFERVTHVTGGREESDLA
jgi:signal transduction histidine kinase